MPNSNPKESGSLLPRISVTRPVTVTMCLVAVLVVGLVSYVRIPMQAFATGLDPSGLFVLVSTPQNTSPHQNDELIGRPMAEHFRTLKGLRDFEVASDKGRTYSYLPFQKGTDMSEAYNRLVERIELLKTVLPERYRDNVRVFKFNPDTDREIISVGVSLPDRVTDPYYAVESQVQHRLERIDGVAQVRIQGASQKEIAIEVDRDRMRARGVDPYGLVEALRADNFEMAGGTVLEGGKKLYVRSLARYRSLEAFWEIPVPARNGTVRLREVADVFYDVPLAQRRQRIDGQPALTLGILRDAGANIVEVCDRVEAELSQIEDGSDFKFETLFSQGDLIRESIRNLRNTGLWGGLFAVLVLFFFLRSFRTTALIALAIPVSVMIAVTMMYFLGWSMNLLTMMGLMVAIGMVVDNATVIVENVFRMRQKGARAHEASIRGASEVGLAISMATLTTVVVFLPLMVMSGDVDLSFFLSKIGVPIVAALVGSLLVALIFIPMAAKRFGGPVVKKEPRAIRWTRRAYAGALGWSLTHRKDTTLILLGLFATAFYPMDRVRKSDALQGVVNTVYVRSTAPKFLTWEELSEVGAEVEEYLDSKRETYGIRTVRFRYQRRGLRRLFYYLYLNKEENHAWWDPIYRGLRSKIGFPLESPVNRNDLIQDMMSTFPRHVGHDVLIEAGSLGGQFETREYLHIRLLGDDLETLERLRGEIEMRMRGIPAITGIDSDEERGDDEIQVRIDRERAHRYEVSPRVVASSIAYQLLGAELPLYRSGNGEFDVRLYLGNMDIQTVQQLKGFTFQSRSGEEIPLSAIASLRVVEGDQRIKRKNGKLQSSLKMYTRMKDLRRLFGQIDLAMDGFNMPRGYSWNKGERFQQYIESEETMKFAVMMAVVCVFLLMGVLFESLILPFSVLLCIPFAFLGVYWTLFLTDTVMDRMAQVGIIVLIGLVVNNAIVLIDRVNQLRAEGHGRMEAILEAGANRFRPILMTTFTTVFGLLPMALSSSTLMGVPYSSMGRAMIGGLLCSTFLTLFVVPLFYTYLDDLRGHLRRIVATAFSRPAVISYPGPEPAD